MNAEFAQLDLGSPQLVVNTIVQARRDAPEQRVPRYRVAYSNVDSNTATDWILVDNGAEFIGTVNGLNGDTKVRGVFRRAVAARYWRIIPTAYTTHMSLRWGVGVGVSNCVTVTAQDACNTNFALSRPTAQSSEAHGGNSARAIQPGDGSTNWGSSTCTHTNYEAMGWWRVDFDGPRAIDTVEVLNRLDCCRERLSGVEVRIGDSTVPNENELCAAVSDERARNGDAKIELTCSRVIRGRFLHFLQRRGDALTLCNVKAYRKC